MNIAGIIRKLKLLIGGSLKTAIREGMHVESGVTCMGGINFGSEPYHSQKKEYLIKLFVK